MYLPREGSTKSALQRRQSDRLCALLVNPGQPAANCTLADMYNWQSEGTGVVSILTAAGKRVTGTVAGTINYTSRATINGHWACVRQG